MNIQWYKAGARVLSNWSISFFGSSLVFGGKMIPDVDILLKAFLFATGLAGLSIGYELRRFGER